jgi:hypothetical protein
MKHKMEDFVDRELELVLVATKLKQALAVEELLDKEGLEYGLEVEQFRGGLLGLSNRTGVFFYALAGQADFCRTLLKQNGYKPIPAPK